MTRLQLIDEDKLIEVRQTDNNSEICLSVEILTRKRQHRTALWKRTYHQVILKRDRSQSYSPQHLLQNKKKLFRLVDNGILFKLFLTDGRSVILVVSIILIDEIVNLLSHFFVLIKRRMATVECIFVRENSAFETFPQSSRW